MYDLAVVGAGIIGLGHALAAARRGKRVIVLDRDAQPNGASIRNFGLVTVTGQDAGMLHERCERSRDIWLDIAPHADIDILHRGLLVVAQRPEAQGVLEAFAATPLGEACTLLSPREVVGRQVGLDASILAGGLYSPHEIRVESRDALPRLVAFLAERHGVDFRFNTAVTAVEPPRLLTGSGPIEAVKIVVCPGDDLNSLYGNRISARGVTRCKLQMLRLADPGFRLSSSLVSDLSLLRYGGFASLPEADALRRRIEGEQPDALANGVHLIVVQSADGSLVIGDSHHYASTPDPFSTEAVEQLILDEFGKLFRLRRGEIVTRWTGTYASAPAAAFSDAPHPDVRLVMVTSGTGASTGFAIGEETVAELFG